MKKPVSLSLFVLIVLIGTIIFIGQSPDLAANPFDVDSTVNIRQTTKESEPAALESSSDAVVSDNEIKIEPEPSEKAAVTVIPKNAEPKDKVANATIEPPKNSNVSKILPGYEDEVISIKGRNYCGQFAMTSVFKGLGIDKEAQDVYKATNPRGVFTSPSVIVEHLNKNGVKAGQRNSCSLEDIAKKIDDGKPVIVLADSGDGTPHWVNIYGYTRDASGKVISVRMRDSYWGTKTGHEMGADDFSKAWKSPFGDTFTGKLATYSNLMIDINGNSTGSPFDTATEDNLASGFNNIVTGWMNRDAGQVIGGASSILLGIPGAALSIASRLPTAVGDKIANWGKDRMSKGGVGNKILGGAAVAGGSVVKAGGWVVNKIGNAASSVAKGIGSGIKKLFGKK